MIEDEDMMDVDKTDGWSSDAHSSVHLVPADEEEGMMIDEEASDSRLVSSSSIQSSSATKEGQTMLSSAAVNTWGNATSLLKRYKRLEAHQFSEQSEKWSRLQEAVSQIERGLTGSGSDFIHGDLVDSVNSVQKLAEELEPDLQALKKAESLRLQASKKAVEDFKTAEEISAVAAQLSICDHNPDSATEPSTNVQIP